MSTHTLCSRGEIRKYSTALSEKKKKKKKKKDVSVAMTKACSFYKSTRYIKHQGPILKASLA